MRLSLRCATGLPRLGKVAVILAFWLQPAASAATAFAECVDNTRVDGGISFRFETGPARNWKVRKATAVFHLGSGPMPASIDVGTDKPVAVTSKPEGWFALDVPLPLAQNLAADAKARLTLRPPAGTSIDTREKKTFTPYLIIEGAAEGAAEATDATTIMAKLAANVEAASDARKRYVYHQKVRSSLVRSSGQISRREKREYSVFPGEKGTEKKLTSFQGEYRKGKQMIPYTDPGYHYKGIDLDGDLIRDLTEDLVNDKESRDGIPHSLFPLRSKDLPFYKFTYKGETLVKGRRTFQIAFEPVKKSTCVNIGIDKDDDCGNQPWMGEALVDAEEYQPVRIDTQLAFVIPWGVRVFLGTNIRQTGFAITYVRVDPNVWFPSTYGTEFRLNLLFGYKRTITLALESDGFQKTDTNSVIQYDTPK